MRNCLVFDLDDTLFPECQYVHSGFMVVDQYLNDKYSLLGFFDVACKLFEQGERGNIFNRYLDRMSIKYDQAAIESIVMVYRSHEPKIVLYEDALWALSYFSTTHRFGLITDGYYVAQNAKLRALGISEKLESIIITDELGREYWKPHKMPYILTQKKLNVPGESCIYIADNPKKDFVTAKKLGWLTIQVKRDNCEYGDIVVEKDYRADVMIGSLFELQGILSSICPAVDV